MLASIFVVQGFDTMLHPERVAPRADPVVQPLAELVPGVLDSTEDAVRLNGAVQFAAGSMLALGILPRLSAMAIAATLVPPRSPVTGSGKPRTIRSAHSSASSS